MGLLIGAIDLTGRKKAPFRGFGGGIKGGLKNISPLVGLGGLCNKK